MLSAEHISNKHRDILESIGDFTRMNFFRLSFPNFRCLEKARTKGGVILLHTGEDND